MNGGREDLLNVLFKQFNMLVWDSKNNVNVTVISR